MIVDGERGCAMTSPGIRVDSVELPDVHLPDVSCKLIP